MQGHSVLFSLLTPARRRMALPNFPETSFLRSNVNFLSVSVEWLALISLPIIPKCHHNNKNMSIFSSSILLFTAIITYLPSKLQRAPWSVDLFWRQIFLLRCCLLSQRPEKKWQQMGLSWGFLFQARQVYLYSTFHTKRQFKAFYLNNNKRSIQRKNNC